MGKKRLLIYCINNKHIHEKLGENVSSHVNLRRK